MAELMQLDRAAALTGKSEVTLRRLIKAGKIPYQKEKTLTGFVYLVDPDRVKAYYQVRGGGMFSDDSNLKASAVFDSVQPVSEAEEAEPVTTASVSGVRVAVANESGDLNQYWQKKADLYEDKYLQEAAHHAQTREELGVWRGRAEQAQSMIMKLLPAPSEPTELSAGAARTLKGGSEGESHKGWSIALTIIIAILFLGLVGLGLVYWKISGH